MYHDHITKQQFCGMIDYALLSQCNPREMLDKFCDDTVKYGFGSLCIFPCDVAYAKKRMGDKGKVCAVVGYPMGANTTATKVFEAVDAVKNGADEIDVVMNISRMHDKDYDFVLDELKQVVQAAKKADPKTVVKVIIEVYWWPTDDLLKEACEIVIKSGADYVKQATGYAPDPYQNTRGIENMAKLRKFCGDTIKLKSAGVPDNLEQCIQMYKEYDIDRFGGRFNDWIDSTDEAYWKDK